MTPLNPSKRVETAKNACREADFGLFCPCNSLTFYHRAIKLKYNVSGNKKLLPFGMGLFCEKLKILEHCEFKIQ